MHSKLFLGNFCFVMKITSYRSTCTAKGTRLTQFKFNHLFNEHFRLLTFRGGVEDTRLEVKAKDTKKIRGQGQGQPFRGQTLSRLRTGMLKAKDQGRKRKCSPRKKKVFKFFFQPIYKILTIQKILLSSSRGQSNFRGLEASRPRPRS